MSTKAHLLDATGAIVHTWEGDMAPGNSAYLLPNGHLLRAARPENNPVFRGGGEGGRIQEFTWDGEVVWDYTLSDEQRLHHHDIAPLPNGNLLLIAWEARTPEQATAVGRRSDHVGPAGVWPDSILEIRPVGPKDAEIVWEWHVWDHLVQNVNPHLPNFGQPADHPGRIDINHATAPIQERESEGDRERRKREEAHLAGLGYMGGDDDDDPNPDGAAQDASEPTPEPERRDVRGADWMHTNGIDYDAELDVIVISVRRFDEIWVIDHSTTTEEARTSEGGRHGRGGDLLWRWGNPAAYGMGGEADQRLFKQHDATFVRTEGRPGRPRLQQRQRAPRWEQVLGRRDSAPDGRGGADRSDGRTAGRRPGRGVLDAYVAAAPLLALHFGRATTARRQHPDLLRRVRAHRGSHAVG